MNIPVIRLEVEYMKRGIITALHEYSVQLDADMKAAVEAFCEPDNIKRVISDAVNRELKITIEAEVRNFFAYGDGRRAIAEAVVESLTKKAGHEKD